MLQTKLLPYQIEHIQKILKIFDGEVGHSRNGVVLCTPWGSGKTLMSIEASRRICRILNSRVYPLQIKKSPILVITQKSIVDTWISSGKTHYKPGLASIFIGGTDTGNQRATLQNWCLIQDYDIVVTNYDTIANSHRSASNFRKDLIEEKLNSNTLSVSETRVLKRFLAQHNKRPMLDIPIPDEELANRESIDSMTPVTQAFFYHKWPVVIVDEGHESRNDDGRVFLSTSQLRAEFKIIPTANPFNNSIQDIISLFTICGIPPV
jgi:SNF2 family DNA or RNA helicase